MNTWLVLLRAVNVGGTAKLTMEDLRASLTACGFSNVTTYIASGNITLKSELGAEEVAQSVNAVLNTQFNISGERSIVLTSAALRRVIKSNPFRDAAQNRPHMLHVHFLAKAAQANAEMNLTSYKGLERLRLDGHCLYVDYVNGAGTTALTGRFLETALGTTGTARNWNTVLKLVEMLG
jgi:uncharacterized protein (DUF1697 family)